MYRNGNELLALCKKHNFSIAKVVIMKEFELFEKTHDDVLKSIKEILKVMRTSSSLAIEKPEENMGHIIGGDAKKMNDYSITKTYSGELINKAMARALSSSEVNASMGKICAAPTAGSCGILPAAILTAEEELSLSEETLLNGLLISAAIGEIITINASVSGAEGGCQAECGSAAAMAAAALVFYKGGSPETSLHAAAITLKNVMGLVCDPVAGLVESPCAKRNASGVVNALISADMALAGMKSIIPFDEVVEAMYKVGKSLPNSLKETALGGIAITKTGKEIKKKIFG